MKSKLFVGNLAVSLEEAELREAFSQYGEILTVKIVRDRETSQSRGFGFVEYRTAEEAARAQQALDGGLLKERAIVVNEARDRRAR